MTMAAAVTDVERRSAAVVADDDAACVIVGEGTGTVAGQTW